MDNGKLICWMWLIFVRLAVWNSGEFDFFCFDVMEVARELARCIMYNHIL